MSAVVYNGTRSKGRPPFRSKLELRQAARVLKCMGHPLRLSLVECLCAQPLHVRQLEAGLGLEQAVVSKHLAILRKGGVVACRPRGRHRLYTVCHPEALRVLQCLKSKGKHVRAVLHN